MSACLRWPLCALGSEIRKELLVARINGLCRALRGVWVLPAGHRKRHTTLSRQDQSPAERHRENANAKRKSTAKRKCEEEAITLLVVLRSESNLLEVGGVVLRANVRANGRWNLSVEHILPIGGVGTRGEPLVLLDVVRASLVEGKWNGGGKSAITKE